MDVLRRIESYCELYAGHDSGIRVVTWFPDGAQTEDLRSFDFTKSSEHRRYWDCLIENINQRIEGREDVEDDWIPGITLHYGFGAFGGIFCDEMPVFTEDTSYLRHQVMDSWEKAAQFGYRKDRFWSEVFVEAAGYLSTRANGRFMTEVYPAPSPLDVANLLRGNAVFTDVYEYPDELRAFLGETVAGLVEHTRNLRQVTQNPSGAIFTFDKCIPTGILLLEDAADLCSSSTYLKFGRPYTQQVCDRLGGAYIHHHSLGRQQFKNIDRITGLFVHQISSDPNCVRPITSMDFLLAQVSGDPVIDLECTVEEIQTYGQRLTSGRYILSVTCKDKDEAKTAVDFVRNQWGSPADRRRRA